MLSQWDCFLKNLGEWHGTFSQLSPTGELLTQIPSILILEGLDDHNQAAKLTLRRFYPNSDGGEPEVKELVREYRSFGREILFFENGHFAQASIQLAPLTECGAEFGFIRDNRRLRLVELFDKEGKLASLTLIQEKLAGTNLVELPPLTVEQLLGTWTGEAVTIYHDLRSPDIDQTQLEITKTSDRITQKLTFGNGDNTKIITSSAQISDRILLFDHSEESNTDQQMQIIFLPSGASATVPVRVNHRQPTFLEAGWLINPDLRQRAIVTYSNKGEWISSTLVTEKKLS